MTSQSPTHTFTSAETPPTSFSVLGDEPSYEPIAIVGLACRLPGAVSSPSSFWELLLDGRSGHCEIPRERFNAAGFYHPDSSRPGSLPSKGGYFLQEDIRDFDNAFFGINNLEARYIDPQQRKLLEVAYECFESGGQTLENLNGSNTGCFVANFTTDFTVMQYKDAEYASHYSATGSAASILANRLNHVFNLRGPTFVVDTACSGSLYSLHLACTALQNGDCDSAVVAGANLIQSPELFLQAVKAGILSNDSTCHTYDASANGYGRAEGAGALFVKRLSDALRDGDPIRAVIRGTALNSNGSTTGISLPDAQMQKAVVQKAYARAGLPIDQTTYVEAHGTGTAVGDPIEVEGLCGAFRPQRKEEKLLIGSVKTNIGHSEGASGISSIIKVILALENRTIPPTIGIKTLNPRLKPFGEDIEIVTKARSWPDGSKLRAGINSFGFGGANAHVILEAADGSNSLPSPLLLPPPANNTDMVIPLSAANKTSLSNVIAGLHRYCNKHEVDLPSLAYTLGCRRSKLLHRAFVTSKQAELSVAFDSERLSPVQEDTPSARAFGSGLAFIFTGQGAQWAGMGAGLMGRFSRFYWTISELDMHLHQLSRPPTWSLLSLLEGDCTEWDINSAQISQPLCTAIQVGLVDVLRHWGVTAAAVVGHSSGEIAAAYCTGALTAKEAITVAYYRGLVVSESPKDGAMAAIGRDVSSVTEIIRNLCLEGKIRVACVNSPENVTVSGDEDAIMAFVEHVKAQSIFARILRTDGRAYHSHHMERIGEKYEDLLSDCFDVGKSEASISSTCIFSTVHGSEVAVSTLGNAKYWRANLESPVQFEPAVRKMMEKSDYALLEIGPHSALQLPLRQIWAKQAPESTGPFYLSTLDRKKQPVSSMLNLAGQMFANHLEVNFERVNELQGCNVLTDLPTYPWHYERIYWNESRISREFRHREHPHHYLLGSRIPGASGMVWSWRNVIRVKDINWLNDHKLGETIVMPAAAYIAMATEALRQRQSLNFSAGTLSITGLRITKALTIPDDIEGVEIVTDLQPVLLSSSSRSTEQFTFEISSFSDTTCISHAMGQVAYSPHMQSRRPGLPHFELSHPPKVWYKYLEEAGLSFGDQFRRVDKVWGSDTLKHEPGLEVLTEVKLSEYQCCDPSGCEDAVHVCLLDALVQSAIISNAGGSLEAAKAMVPVSFEAVTISLTGSKPQQGRVHACSNLRGSGVTQNTVELVDTKGIGLIHMQALRLIDYNLSQQLNGPQVRNPMLRVDWQPHVSLLRHRHRASVKRYLSDMNTEERTSNSRPFRVLQSLLRLILHHRSDRNMLLVVPKDSQLIPSIFETCRSVNGMQRIRKLTVAVSTDDQLLGKTFEFVDRVYDESALQDLGEIELGSSGPFDTVIAAEPSIIARLLHHDTANLPLELAEDAYILTLQECESISSGGFEPNTERSLLFYERLYGSDKSYDLCLVKSNIADPTVDTRSGPKTIYIISDDRMTTIDENLAKSLERDARFGVKLLPLSSLENVDLISGSTVFFTVELQRSLLGATTPAEFAGVQKVTQRAKNIFWLTSGSFLEAKQPHSALVLGLSRALILEQPATKFFVIDLETSTTSDNSKDTCLDLIKILEYGLADAKIDLELVQRDGIFYSSRFVPDPAYNEEFRTKQQKEIVEVPVVQIQNCELSCKMRGDLDSLYWRELPDDTTDISSDLEIDIKSYGLNFRDLSIASSSIDTEDGNCSLECTGFVVHAAQDDSEFVAGDRVVAMVPQKIRSRQRVPAWACAKLQKQEDLMTISTIPFVFSTAIYALQECARIQKGESVLIHSAAGCLGQALIQVAQLHDALIYATVGTDEKKKFLTETYGLDPARIFSSKSSDFLASVMAATNGEGVDIAVNSLQGDLLQATLKCCADFGRFIEVGRRDIQDFGKLDMSAFNRNVSVTPFDLTHLFYSKQSRHHRVWQRLLYETLGLYRLGMIHPIQPLEVVDMSEPSRAFEALQSSSRIGKVALSLQNEKALLKVQPLKYRTVLDPQKHYLMVGALGGLGRSVSKWMLARGAQYFTFLNRSGLDKEEARELVADLERRGARVRVVRGSVDVLEDVQRAILETKGPIGGVVHAAMGLAESLFASMTWEQWTKAIRPKVHGTWNLHNSLKEHEQSLDFFLLTSSISGSVGTATESNYCAANSFQDAFARHRRSLGLKAVSVGLGMISEVGYLHEHPDIEKLLLRKGIHPINEDELSQIMDISIALESRSSLSPSNDASSMSMQNGHILTGMELVDLEGQRKHGFEGHSHILDDPRSSLLAYNFERQSVLYSESGRTHCEGALDVQTASVEELRRAAGEMVTKKIANLVLVKAEELQSTTRLSDFSMDSMLAAEFRGHIFNVLRVDIPFMTILGTATTIGSLTELAVEGLLKQRDGDST